MINYYKNILDLYQGCIFLKQPIKSKLDLFNLEYELEQLDKKYPILWDYNNQTGYIYFTDEFFKTYLTNEQFNLYKNEMTSKNLLFCLSIKSKSIWYDKYSNELKYNLPLNYFNINIVDIKDLENDSFNIVQDINYSLYSILIEYVWLFISKEILYVVQPKTLSPKYQHALKLESFKLPFNQIIINRNLLDNNKKFNNVFRVYYENYIDYKIDLENEFIMIVRYDNYINVLNIKDDFNIDIDWFNMSDKLGSKSKVFKFSFKQILDEDFNYSFKDKELIIKGIKNIRYLEK